MALFEIQNFSFAYPKTQEPALKEISFSLEEGELFLLSGASGSGKTTLLRQLKPAIAPYGKRQGAVLYEGRPVEELEKRRAALEIGFVFQSPDAQIVTDRVSSELAFGLENAGVPPEEIRRRVAEMAGFFGIEGWYHKAIEALSGGQRQMLNLASVMVMNPKVLILDEPTAQLDPIAAAEFLSVLSRLHRDFGTTILLSEHRLELVLPEAEPGAGADHPPDRAPAGGAFPLGGPYRDDGTGKTETGFAAKGDGGGFAGGAGSPLEGPADSGENCLGAGKAG